MLFVGRNDVSVEVLVPPKERLVARDTRVNVPEIQVVSHEDLKGDKPSFGNSCPRKDSVTNAIDRSICPTWPCSIWEHSKIISIWAG